MSVLTVYKGAGIEVSVSTQVFINSSTFTGNNAFGGNGGAVEVTAIGTYVVISGCNFFNNSCSGSGGAVSVQDGTVQIRSCLVLQNTAVDTGGACTSALVVEWSD